MELDRLFRAFSVDIDAVHVSAISGGMFSKKKKKEKQRNFPSIFVFSSNCLLIHR